MPEKGNNTLKFNNFHKQLPVPFLIHVDFEAITEKIYIYAYQTIRDLTLKHTTNTQTVDMVIK